MVGNVLLHKKFDHPSIKCLRAINECKNQKLQNPNRMNSVFNNINYLSMCETYVFS